MAIDYTRYSIRYRYARAHGIRLRRPGGNPYGNRGGTFSRLWHIAPLPAEALVCCDIPGPALLCCGQWQKITTLPHRCAVCGRTWLEEQG